MTMYVVPCFSCSVRVGWRHIQRFMCFQYSCIYHAGQLLFSRVVLTKLDARFNGLGDEGEKVLRDAAEGREGFQLLL